MDRLIVGAAIS